MLKFVANNALKVFAVLVNKLTHILYFHNQVKSLQYKALKRIQNQENIQLIT
jgi:hypothetical protein